MQAAIENTAADLERMRVHAVVNTLAAARRSSATLGEITHDARNMVTALAIYCDLLAEPGVLTEGHAHYANELRLVTAASRRLIEKLMLLDAESAIEFGPALGGGRPADREGGPTLSVGSGRPSANERLPNYPIANLQQELLANRNLLDAMAGLAIDVNVRTEGGARPVRLTGEDLTRVLVNLVKNASEAMRRTGSIEITLRDLPDPQGGVAVVVLTVEDSGPGILEDLLEKIFESGYTSHAYPPQELKDCGWPVAHRGLGLSITRSIIEAAGGRMGAANRPGGGARFEIELPVRTR